MTARSAIMARVRELVRTLDKKMGIDKALLFGSSARGDRLADSDIDIILVSNAFAQMEIPERQSPVQREWSYDEDLNALTYTPEEFKRVSKRLTMEEILSYAIDILPRRGKIICPICGKRGSMQTKIVRNAVGKAYQYLYVAHYSQGKVTWCYLGRPEHARYDKAILARAGSFRKK